jgi:hypothetical protein
VRARLAAAVFRDAAGRDRPLLFIDAVEGRFDIKPRLIKRAIEEYAADAGFEMVFYYAYPLNQVPLRFTRYVAASSAQLERLSIAYVGDSQREYLDAFGLPLEPFEYAFPRGEVLGYAVELCESLQRSPLIPSSRDLLLGQVRDKGLLWALTAASLACLGWTLWIYDPRWLLPAAGLAGATLFWDALLQRRSLRCEKREDALGEPEIPDFLRDMREAIARDPLARKMRYPAQVERKIEQLRGVFPTLDRRLEHFFEAVLYNVSVKDTDLVNVLKFVGKLPPDQRQIVEGLFAVVWNRPDAQTLAVGLSNDKKARDAEKQRLMAGTDAIRKCVKSCRLTGEQVRQILAARRALRLEILDVLKVVSLRPRILRGLRKTPRPIFSWFGPVTLGLLAVSVLFALAPTLSSIWIQSVFMAIVAPGVYLVSTRLAIAPGVLSYAKTRSHLAGVLAGTSPASAIRDRMEALGIRFEEFAKAHLYEDREQGVRIAVRDKRTLEGAVQFLTSSEEIGNCIALRNFVAWVLPSLLADDAVMLADVYYKGSQTYGHRAQIWMIAAEQDGIPVLTINSFEFNNEGAKYLDVLMEHCVGAIQDVAARAGFQRIYAGISDYGRSYLDRSFPQAQLGTSVRKIHAPEAGYRYYFDAFRLRRSMTGGRLCKEYVYMARRTLAARGYALGFGLLELLKGNRAKALAFWDTVANPNNGWEIPTRARVSLRSEPVSHEEG